MTNNKNQFYEKRAEQFHLAFKKAGKALNLYAFLRLLCFVVFGTGLYFSLKTNAYVITGISAAFVVIFLILLKLYTKTQKNKEYCHLLEKINRDELKSLQHEFTQFENGAEYIDKNHQNTYDLDIFGEGSVFQFINRTVTIAGKQLLAGWLQRPFTEKKEITDRQNAVRELADCPEWRHHFMALGLQHKESAAEKTSLLEWINEPVKTANSLFFKTILIAVPAVTFAVLILAVLQVIPGVFAGLAVVLQLFIVGNYLRLINRIHAKVTDKVNMLRKYARLINEIESRQFASGKLNEMLQCLKQDNIPAGKRIRNLEKILKAFDNRLNLLAGFILNSLLLWDLQCWYRIEKWKNRNKQAMPVWFDVIAGFDAFTSLANYHFNHPDFVFPEITDQIPLLETKSTGHPLIPREKRVCNDFSLTDFGQFTIITGANMAGKSTFLRTTGVNLLLAMTGAPVCAKQWRFFPVHVYTSMRTSDSLHENESYFYAELKRLKILIQRLEKGEKLFIILDEILKGTNSTDKQQGSLIALEKLAYLNGAGIIATHDLSLGKLEEKLPRNIRNMSFEVEIEGDKIHFDYILRRGITRKMNAELLMKQMGII